MALKLEELINKKKEPNQILDLSRIKIKNREEFEKYLDKVPEFKIRPEKVSFNLFFFNLRYLLFFCFVFFKFI